MSALMEQSQRLMTSAKVKERLYFVLLQRTIASPVNEYKSTFNVYEPTLFFVIN